MVNVNNGLIGLSILGGTSAYNTYSSGLSSSDSPAVTRAKQAFTLPQTTPPWEEEPTTSSTSAQITAIKKMLSIIDTESDSSLEDLPDIEASFTIYKALDRLRVIAESAAKSTTSETERTALNKVFAKGMADLQAYMGSAQTDMLTLNYGVPTRRVQTVAVTKSDVTGSVVAGTTSIKRSDVIAGLTGTEVFQFTLTKGSTTETVQVDLSQITDPLNLDTIANAFNAAIGATPQLDAGGNPVLDADGNVVSQWQSNFSLKYTDEKWGLVFNPSGIENVAIDQVGGTDAIVVASGETRRDSYTDASLFRFEDIDGAMTRTRLGSIASIDADATAQAATAASRDDDEDVDYTVHADTKARSVVTDAEGFSYIVGTTDGDVGTNLSDGEDDLFLTKVDSEGKIVWQRSLGASGSAQGAAVSIAPNGEIVVAGTVSSAFSGSDGSDTDILVARFNARGEELSATAVRQLGNESASALTIGDDGSIYVAGRASSGGGDAFIVKLDATGKQVERRTIDSGGADLVTALEIDGSGNLLALTKENGVATLRRIDSTSIANDLGSIALGAVEARAIAVSDSGQIAVVGAAATAVSGSQTNAISGARDAFVTMIGAGLGSASTTYIGSAEDDQADSATWMNGTLYVGGRSNGTISGTKSGTVDGFLARLDASGTLEAVSQWGLVATTTEPVRVSAASGGSTALGALGLARGTLNQRTSATLTSQTSIRAGDEFTIKVDDGSTRTITIDASETMTTLSQKIRRITGTAASVSTALVDGKTSLRIQVAAGHSIELGSGANGEDALTKLGIEPVRLVAKAATDADDDDENTVTPGGTYSLALSSALNLGNAKTAAVALSKIGSAISMIQSAYRSLYWDSTKAARVDGTLATAAGSAYQQKQLANYQAALSRLTGS